MEELKCCPHGLILSSPVICNECLKTVQTPLKCPHGTPLTKHCGACYKIRTRAYERNYYDMCRIDIRERIIRGGLDEAEQKDPIIQRYRERMNKKK